MRRITIYSLMIWIGFCSVAAAQDAVTLRTGSHADYTRAVFDWPSSVPYTLQKTNDSTLTVSFQNNASLRMGETEHGASEAITNVRTLSAAGQPLSVAFDIVAGSRYRHFLVGSRVVIDVYKNGTAQPQAPARPATTAAAPSQQDAPQPPPQKPNVTAPVKEAAPEAVQTTQAEPPPMPAKRTAPQKSVEITTTSDGPKVESNPVLSVLAQAIPEVDPHVITISSTESVGMAAFIRNDTLWMVLDKASINVDPQVAGPQVSLFGLPQRHEVKGGVAFSIELPHSRNYELNYYGEGGGLVWRIVATPSERAIEPAELERTFEVNKFVRGGTLVWDISRAGQVLEFTDPEVGDTIMAVTVSQSDQFAGPARHMVDLTQLRSVVGLAITPKADDIKLSITPGGVAATRGSGLAVSRQKDVSRKLIRRDVQEASLLNITPDNAEQMRRIYDFDRWLLGGVQNLADNQRILLSNMANKDKNGKAQDLLTLAKMYMANDRGPEALGFLEFALSELPDLKDSPEFLALRGGAAAIAGKYEMAFRDLFHPLLENYDELDYWRSYNLAWLEDWRQAVEMMPEDFTVLVSYPKPLLAKLGLKLAEVALRDGDVQTAEGILAVLQKSRDRLPTWTTAGMDYLKGEAHRQSNELNLTKELWGKLAKGEDDWHRAKAGLALTLLELDNGDISTETAIDRLEGLRYAWRGDELEAQINYLLGRLYLESDRYLKGFGILRESTSMSPDSDIGKEITAFMRQEFKDLLIKDKDLDPLQAVEVYEEFRELTPSDDEGNLLGQRLAERLVEADLLDRAANILQHQVDHRITGEERARIATRLGTLYLLNGNARPAMAALQTARDTYAQILEGGERADKLREIDLLRARGYSQLNRTEEAIDLLNGFPPDPTINRLRADIAWQAGLWEDAAEALQDLIIDASLDLNRPLKSEEADLILNRAVALNLSGNRVALTNMRRRYGDAMKKTARARLFDVVTRQRQNSILADKETIESIVKEVDMFSDFLESYKTTTDGVSN